MLEIINLIRLAYKHESKYLHNGNYWHMIWAEQYKRKVIELLNAGNLATDTSEQ